MALNIPNQNWPTLFAEADFGSNPYYTPSASLIYTDITPRLYKQWTMRRGKQYELDQVQPAEFHGQLVNTDGFLDPTNTSSPYSPGVLPYRGLRLRAQYPPSYNLLSADQATGGEGTPLAPGAIPASLNVISDVGATLTIASSGSAYQGTQVFQAAVPASVSAHFYLIYFRQIPIQSPSSSSSATYTWSTYVRCTTSGINPTVAPALKFFDINGNFIDEEVGGNVVLTGSPSATWTQLTISRSMSVASGAAYVNLAVAMEGTPPSSTWTLQEDGCQFEQNSSASAFSVPGTGYPIYSGLVERYPQSWDFNGTYGLVNPIGVDTMALLSQMILKEAFIMDIVATSPAWCFPLNDQSGSTTFLEQAGRTPAATVFNSAYGAGTVAPGTTITAANLATGKFLGTNGPVTTITNTGTPLDGGSVINLIPAGITGPPSSGGWSRMLAFRTSLNSGLPVIAAATSGYSPGSAGYNSNWYLQMQITTGSNMSCAVSMYTDSGTNSGVFGGSGAVTVNDNNWHLVIFTLSASGTNLNLYIDGVNYNTVAGTNMHSSLTTTDAVGGDAYLAAGTVGFGGNSIFTGDVALYTQWNTELSSGTVASLYNSWRTAYQGERSDQRYSRILGWAGFQGAQSLDVGTTTSMGPANDVNGLDALTCLENVVSTEAGRHFIGSNGAANFQSRTRFFQTTTPVWTFGENQGSGEIPYIDVQWDFDPTRIANQAAITQVTTSQVYYANDATSQQNYGVRSLTRSNQSTNAEEVREAAYFYVGRYKIPYMRISSLKVDAAANPALWSTILAFELGQYVQINRRDETGARPMISQFGFIEQITHSADDQGKWQVELQMSPGAIIPYASFTSLRTTSSGTASSGQPTITINALPDAATNPVRSQLTGGQILMISGGGNSETLTIATGGVQDALAGYSTATVTFTTNLAHTYTTGATVVEATGANYDALAHFDAVQFAY